MDEEQFFNINALLKNVFLALDQNCQNKTPSMVFHFEKTVPCQMKGDITTLYSVLLKIVRELVEEACSTEIIIYVDAPEEFLYKELVTFSIGNIAFKEDRFMPKLEEMLSKDLEHLDASLTFTQDHGGRLNLVLPLVTAELGCRRHYRMPSRSMLNKDILLVINSNNLALSLTKMFKYFPMNVDVSIHRYKDKFDLSRYDLVLIEDSLYDFRLHDLLLKAQQKKDVKFVLLGNSDIYEKDDTTKLHTAFLEKPVTQESVYKLLLKLFDETPTVQ